MNTNWGPAAIIVFGYIVAAFWQNKRVDDMKTWLEAEFRNLNEKFDRLDVTTRDLDKRVRTLEDSRLGVR